MIENRVDAEVDQATFDAIQDSLQAVLDALPFLVTLSASERRSILKGGDRSQAFIRKAIDVGAMIEHHLPRSVSIETMRRDVALTEQLHTLILSVEQLAQKLSDTHMVAASEAYATALLVYRTGKNVKGSEPIRKAMAELSQRFDRSQDSADTDTDVDADSPADANERPSS